MLNTISKYIYTNTNISFIEICDYTIKRLKYLNHRVGVKKYMALDVLIKNIDRQYSYYDYLEEPPGLETINDTFLKGSSYILHKKFKIYNSKEELEQIHNFYYYINKTINRINDYKNLYIKNEDFLYKVIDEKILKTVLENIYRLKELNKYVNNSISKTMIEKRLEFIEKEIKKKSRKHIGLIIMALFEMVVLSSDLVANTIAIKKEYLENINKTASVITYNITNINYIPKTIDKF
jgi:hypothetical protein